MNLTCPYCGEQLIEGSAEIQGTVWGFLLVGLSYQNLYFKRQGEKKIKILGSGCATSALRCENCDVVILNKDGSDDAIRIDDDTFAKINRDNIIGLLILWASKESQLKYQKNAPTAQVSNELFSQWEDFYLRESEDFRTLFSDEELIILEEFNVVLNRVAELTPEELPYIEEFVKTKEWEILNLKAIETLERLKSIANK